MADKVVRENGPFSLEAGLGVDLGGSNEFKLEGLNPALDPLHADQLGMTLPDVYLGVGYGIPINALGGSELRFSGGGYGNWQHMQTDGNIDPSEYGACDAETDPTCTSVDNTEAEKSRFTVWRTGVFLGTEFDSSFLRPGGVEIPLGVHYTFRGGVMSVHNQGGEFYAGATMPHNENEEHSLIFDTQHRIGATAGVGDYFKLEIGATIDGGTGSKLNSEIGGYSDLPGADFVSSGAPSTFDQTAGLVGGYAQLRVIIPTKKANK